MGLSRYPIEVGNAVKGYPQYQLSAARRPVERFLRGRQPFACAGNAPKNVRQTPSCMSDCGVKPLTRSSLPFARRQPAIPGCRDPHRVPAHRDRWRQLRPLVIGAQPLTGFMLAIGQVPPRAQP